ncbi:inorganic diphosphatase [Myxococcus landrumensis]|uniref:inorganic diphosphatase n=1 Tax=Myxococcus landrumensis TaxID=2813577 RepID=A0ABX7MXQ8_9BACT|nr:inorganic diphosphatase [Myxococcus landrumus]QSQ11133.1 inorganic diphosphatase [Myxococcus landrumus]
MTDFSRLPTRGLRGAFHVVVESPRGSTVKLKYDAPLGAFSLSRPMPRGMRYPFDWGFIPSTKGPDGDPLDAMVLWDEATWPGVVLPCRALGVLQVDQKRSGGKPDERERNDRILAVPMVAPRYEFLRTYEDVSQLEREELAYFFLAAVHFENKDARILGWEGPEAVETMLAAQLEAGG